MRMSSRSNLWSLTLATVLATGVALSASVAEESSQESLRNELGITYAKEGHFEDALRSFSLVLAANPEHAGALNNSANIYFVQGEPARARKLYERAITAAPTEGGIHLNRGILLHSIGERQASAAAVRAGLELIGDPHEAYWLLGLSSRPPGADDRADDARALKASEIEDLLARAMADIPAAAREGNTATPEDTAPRPAAGEDAKVTSTTPGSSAPASPAATISTRPGGAKASQASSDIVAERLFWMSVSKNP